MVVTGTIVTNIIILLYKWATQPPDKIAPKYYNMDSKKKELFLNSSDSDVLSLKGEKIPVTPFIH